ncbi:MAG: hypothetical protein AAF389_06740 [Gemmatimonadota bacterium]
MRTELLRRLSALTFTAMAVIGTPIASSGQEVTGEAARVRAQEVLPPAVFEEVTALVTEMESQGVPSEPLFAKAIEGTAKGIPSDRFMPGVRAYAGRLGQSRGALGPQASIPLVIAGADAIQRGVPTEALRSLPTDRPRSPIALLVLSELVESGVPADRAIAVLRQSMDQRVQDQNMLNISARVRRLIRDGVPPAEAIDRVRRAIRRNRGGQLGPNLPAGDQVINDRRILRDRIRRSGGGV